MRIAIIIVSSLILVVSGLVACDDDSTQPAGDSELDWTRLEAGVDLAGDTAAGDLAAPDQSAGDGATDGPPAGELGVDGSADAPPPAVCQDMDAVGVGLCELVLGVKWADRRCEQITGCTCQGTDCSSLYASTDECQLANHTCLCPAMEAAGVGACKMLIGVKWDGKSCVAFGGCSCTGADCAFIYGSTGSSAQCELDHRICTSCEPMEASGSGPCSAVVGYIWDGAQCTSISGCSCTGADCGEIYADSAACQAGQAHCPLQP